MRSKLLQRKRLIDSFSSNNPQKQEDVMKKFKSIVGIFLFCSSFLITLAVIQAEESGQPCHGCWGGDDLCWQDLNGNRCYRGPVPRPE